MSVLPVAIIGAGPYGLSIAAHLRAQGVEFRIFGSPMYNWRMRMPAGMWLKSEGLASNLSDPEGRFTLKDYCAQNGAPYADFGLPVPLKLLCAYGLAFQKRFVPDLEERMVVSLDTSPNGFVVRLDDGETVAAHKVVVATGFSNCEYIPESFAHVPAEFLSHSTAHHDVDTFKGRRVTVIGAGSSALDLAGLLHEAGADVHLVARRRVIEWTDPPMQAQRPLWQRIRYPVSGMGFGLHSRFYEDFPHLFRYLPEQMRLEIVKTFLGPAPPWFMKDRVEGHVAMQLGATVGRPEVRGEKVYLPVTDSNGARTEVESDHIISATGLRVNLHRMPILNRNVLSRVRAIENTPVLSAHFETTVRGLYFVGLPAANSFGPLMRFMCGTPFVARRVSAHIAAAHPSRVPSRPGTVVSHAQT